jgi:hypothetical protein
LPSVRVFCHHSLSTREVYDLKIVLITKIKNPYRNLLQLHESLQQYTILYKANT